MTYDDSLSLRDALALYFETNSFGADGGYAKKWVDIDLLGLKLKIPNTASRRKAVKIHDLHHVVTDYETDWHGETEISAFELAAGCGTYSAAWVLNLQAFFVGLFTGPRRMFAAFRRGRRCTSLYQQNFDDTLLAATVGSVRDSHGLRLDAAKTTAADWLWFGACAIGATLFSAATVVVLFSPILLLVWLFA